MMTTVHLLNHSPTSVLNGETSYEAWHGHSYLRIFGCLAFVKELNHIGKLDDHSSPRVLSATQRGLRPTVCSTR